MFDKNKIAGIIFREHFSLQPVNLFDVPENTYFLSGDSSYRIYYISRIKSGSVDLAALYDDFRNYDFSDNIAVYLEK